MDKLPWFPFYGRDFFGDENVKLFTARQIGIYLNLLWHEWEHGSIPNLDGCKRFQIVKSEYHSEMIANYTQGPAEFSSIEGELEAVHSLCFVQSVDNEHRYINQRLESVRHEQDVKQQSLHDRARKGGLAKAVLKHTSSTAYGLLKPAIQNQNQNQNQKKTKIKIQEEDEEIKIPGTVQDSVPKVNGIETWEAYRSAYKIRYGVDPVRNQTVNSQLCQFVKKIGVGESPHVAAFYVTHNSQWYVTKGHPVNLLVADAEKLRTEWATNTQVTSSQARQVDGRSARAQMWNELIEESKHKEGKA